MTGDCDNRVLVTRKSSGLGSDLISVVGAVHFAASCGREVLIDWRRSRYLSDPEVNLFPLLFDAPDEIEGVPVRIAPPRLVDVELPQPILYSRDWPFRRYHRDMLRHTDPDQPCVVVTRPMHHLPDSERQRRILESIKPIERLQARIQRFSRENLSGRRVIGVHIRHGGGERMGRRHHWIRHSLDVIYDRCLQACRKLGYPEAQIFLCTDNQRLRDHFAARHADLIVFPSRLVTQGPLHTAANGLKGAEDALQEMYLLSRCQYLVYNPSWFSHYARIMGAFSEPPTDIDGRTPYGTMQLYQDRVRWLGIPHLAGRTSRKLTRFISQLFSKGIGNRSKT